jgi:hypothetical protein
MESIFPSSKFILVTPSDTVPLTYQGKKMKTKYISFKTAGDLAIKDEAGTTVVITNGALGAGVMHRIATDYIMSTGTAAASIVAWF